MVHRFGETLAAIGAGWRDQRSFEAIRLEGHRVSRNDGCAAGLPTRHTLDLALQTSQDRALLPTYDTLHHSGRFSIRSVLRCPKCPHRRQIDNKAILDAKSYQC